MAIDRKLASDALSVQDACNPLGVSRAFVRVLDDIRDSGVTGTDDLRSHPVAVLWAHKLADLFRVADCGSDLYADAYRQCQEGVTNG